MRLRELQRNWDLFGRTDPLWAILTAPQFRGNHWDLGEFFQHGQREIADLLAALDGLGLAPSRGRALDFGCGVGRLTQALGDHFERCDEVDIAPSMIDQARQHNRHGERCAYHLNEVDDLSLFADAGFDLVVSSLVLQHMEPQYAKRYLAELIRVLRPGGVAVLQLPVAERAVAEAEAAPPVPLPAGAHRARISSDTTALTASAAAPLLLAVTVANAGEATWPAQGQVRLGNHWLATRGNRLVRDDGRADLPREVPPGGEAALVVEVVAPARPGRYLLELDMVEEQVTWFSDQGSATLRIPALVRATRRSPLDILRSRRRPTRPEPQPVMEMHCVPQEEVVAIVEAASARVVDVTENGGCGPGYVSCRFVITRDPARATASVPAAP